MEPSKPTLFDEIGVYLLYIILLPTFLGLLFSKYICRCFYKSLINLKFKKPKKFGGLCWFGLFLTAIILAVFLFSLLEVILFKQTIWFYVMYAVIINVVFIPLLAIPTIIVINNHRIVKTITLFNNQNFVEITAEAKNDKVKIKSIKRQYLFFTDFLLIKSSVDNMSKTDLKTETCDEQMGVILNKERNIYVPSEILNRGTIVFGVTGGGKTNTLELFVKYGILNSENIIIINGKGDIDLFNDLKVLSQNNNYVFKCWSPKFDLSAGEAFIYNPFEEKDVNCVTSMLMEIGRYSLLEASAPAAMYYKDNEMACINLVCRVLVYKQQNHDLNDQEDYSLSIDNLFKFADLIKLHEALNVSKILKKDEKEELDRRFKFYVNLKDKIKKAIFDNTIDAKFSSFREEAWNVFEDNPEKVLYAAWCSNLAALNSHIDKVFNGVKYARQNFKNVSEDEEIDKIDDQNLRLLLQDYLDVARDDDKAKALRQIRTTFRNLRNLNSPEHKVLSGEGTNLKSIIKSSKPTILLISLDTTALKTQSSQVARMLIADLKQNLSSIRSVKKDAHLMCIFDEFGSFATQDIAELQEQSRSFGVQAIYSIQTLSNLTQIGESFASRITGNCNTYIIHRMREDKGAESVANIIGTNPAFEETERYAEGAATGEKSVREVQQYIFHPREIRQLDDHHVFISTVFDGKMKPIKGAVKVDYADITNYFVDENVTHSQAPTSNGVADLKLAFTPKPVVKHK